MATVDLTASVINPGRGLLASAARFVSSMKKRITAGQPSPTPTPPPPSTQPSPSPPTLLPTSLAPTVDHSTSSPFSSSTLRAHLKSLSRRFSLSLQDDVKKQLPEAVSEFNDLFADVSRLEEKQDLPADVEVQVSGLYERMRVLKEAVQRWGGELRTSEEVEAVKEEAMRRLMDTERELHEAHLQQMREEREKLKRGAAKRRRQRRKKEEEEEGDSSSDKDGEEAEEPSAADATNDDEGEEEQEEEEEEAGEEGEGAEEEEEAVAVVPAAAKRGSRVSAVQSTQKARVSEDPFAISPVSSRVYSVKRPRDAPTSPHPAASRSAAVAASSRTQPRSTAASTPSIPSSAPSRRRASVTLSTPIINRRSTRVVEAAPEVRQVKRRRVVEEKNGLSVPISQVEQSRRNITKETRHMRTEQQQRSRDGEQTGSQSKEIIRRVTRSRG